MHSCLYEGWVTHRRDAPAHAFRFPLAMLYLDLDEAGEVFRGRWCWSARRPALAWVRRRDHLGDPRAPLADAVRDLVEAGTGRRPRGPIRLLTHPRYAGYAFNPLSLFYCFDPSGTTIDAIVADVTNTPWMERHQYVLRRDDASPGDRWTHPKTFHVSPFLPMTLDYDWRIGAPADRLGVHIAARPRGAGEHTPAAFTATLGLERRALDGAALRRVLVRYPLQTAQVVAGIYWQAWQLWRRGAAFHPHPAAPGAAEGRS